MVKKIGCCRFGEKVDQSTEVWRVKWIGGYKKHHYEEVEAVLDKSLEGEFEANLGVSSSHRQGLLSFN